MSCKPFMGGDGEVTPSLVAYGDSFSLRVKSRLRRLRFDTRLRAQPLGGKPLAAARRPQGKFRPEGLHHPLEQPPVAAGADLGAWE